jgi:hypothetical protein
LLGAEPRGFGKCHRLRPNRPPSRSKRGKRSDTRRPPMVGRGSTRLFQGRMPWFNRWPSNRVLVDRLTGPAEKSPTQVRPCPTRRRRKAARKPWTKIEKMCPIAHFRLSKTSIIESGQSTASDAALPKGAALPGTPPGIGRPSSRRVGSYNEQVEGKGAGSRRNAAPSGPRGKGHRCKSTGAFSFCEAAALPGHRRYRIPSGSATDLGQVRRIPPINRL